MGNEKYSVSLNHNEIKAPAYWKYIFLNVRIDYRCQKHELKKNTLTNNINFIQNIMQLKVLFEG